MPASSADPELHSLIVALRVFVLQTKTALDEEIRSYPTPIPRCDAQFNAAYEQRSRLAALIPQFDAAVKGGDAERLSVLAEFAAMPSLGDGVDERNLRESVAAELSRALTGGRKANGSAAPMSASGS